MWITLIYFIFDNLKFWSLKKEGKEIHQQLIFHFVNNYMHIHSVMLGLFGLTMSLRSASHRP